MRPELRSGCIARFKPILEAFAPGFIAGGAVRDYFSQSKEETDIDVFFANGVDMRDCLERLKSQEGVKKIYDNDLLAGFLFSGLHVQVIKTHFFALPVDAIAAFDFTVCCAAVSLDNVFVHEFFFDDLAGRRLAINALPFPLSTLERMQRYIKKGYIACNGTLLTLAKAIATVDFSDPQGNTLAFYPDGSPRFVRFD